MKPAPILTGFILIGVFLAGGFIGWGLADIVAPGSGLATAFGGLMLPASLCLGLLAWAGLGYSIEILRAILGLARRSPRRSSGDSEVRLRGAGVFVPISVVLSAVTGLVSGLVPGGMGVIATTTIYTGVGLSYGLLLRWLAVHGFLPAAEGLE